MKFNTVQKYPLLSDFSSSLVPSVLHVCLTKHKIDYKTVDLKIVSNLSIFHLVSSISCLQERWLYELQIHTWEDINHAYIYLTFQDNIFKDGYLVFSIKFIKRAFFYNRDSKNSLNKKAQSHPDSMILYFTKQFCDVYFPDVKVTGKLQLPVHTSDFSVLHSLPWKKCKSLTKPLNMKSIFCG